MLSGMIHTVTKNPYSRSTNSNDQVRDYFGRTNDGSFICKACGKTQKSYSNMRQHVESKHYSPGYTCENCGKIFQAIQSYNKHQKKCFAVFEQPQFRLEKE